MSVTTTDNPVTSSLRETLQDYEIRLTGARDLPEPAPWVRLTDHEAPEGVANPPGWDDAPYRGMPRYRPINYHLDREQRPWGSNAIETGFVVTMFHGVWLTAVSSPGARRAKPRRGASGWAAADGFDHSSPTGRGGARGVGSTRHSGDGRSGVSSRVA